MQLLMPLRPFMEKITLLEAEQIFFVSFVCIFHNFIDEGTNINLSINNVGIIHITADYSSGCSVDWAKGNGFKYSYTIELRDEGNYGFLLPPSGKIVTGKFYFMPRYIVHV